MRISGWGILNPLQLLWPESQTRYIISAYYLKVSRDLIAIFLPLSSWQTFILSSNTQESGFLDACFNMANCMEMLNSWSIKLSCFKQDAVHSTALIHCKKSYFSFVKSTFSILPTTSTFVQSSSKTIRSKMWIILFANAMLQTKTIILLCTKSPCTFYKCEILFFAVHSMEKVLEFLHELLL